MHFTKSLFLLFIFLQYTRIGAQKCNAYLPGVRGDLSQEIICPEAMLNDLHNLRDALDKIHPDLYYYTTKEQFDSAYKVAVIKVSNDMTAYEFSKTIAQFLSTIKDSHTSFNQQSLLFLGPKNKGTLPFFLIKIGDKFYLESIYNETGLIGREILQFNEYTVHDIFKESKSFGLIEGSAYSAQDEIATRGMALTFSQMCNFKVSDSVKIKYVNGNDTLTKSVKATTKMNLFSFKGHSSNGTINFFFDQENKGVIKIQTFQPKSMNLFKKELAKFFDEVANRNCSDVIIDLRDNQGGYVKAQEYLVSFLNFKNKQYAFQHVYKRSEFDPFDKMPYLKKMRFKLIAQREYPYGIHSEEYDFMKSELGSVHKISYNEAPKNEQNQTYKGKCTLITNGLSMSASVLFAGWFRNSERGEIVGLPCLGPISGTFGTSANINLPITGLPLSISTVKFNPQYSKEAQFEAIIPDQLINYSIEDILLNRDPVWKHLNINRESLQSLK